MGEAKIGAELAKFVMMKSCFEINFWRFINILFYSKLFNLEIAVKIGKNEFYCNNKTKSVRSAYKLQKIWSNNR